MHSKKILGAFAITAIAAAAMTACGGGGGSAGTAHQRYEVKVTASPDALPTNYAGRPALGGIMDNPYYSIIRVDVKEGSKPAPTTTLQCSVDDYDVGALFDPGKEDDLIKDDNGKVIGRKLWRNIIVDSTAGVGTFGLLAGDKAGDVRVTCSAQDPRDEMQTSGSAIVHVGYTTGLPAQIDFVTSAGVDGLSVGSGLPVPAGKVLNLQIRVVDAALQPVPDPANENLLIELLQTGSPAEQGARLGPLPWGTTVHASTMNGVAQYWLTAGENEGTLCMRVTTDRNDNNVENGFADPLSAVYCADVGAAGDLQLSVPPAVVVGANGGSTAVTATGGTAPYTYMLTGAGLSGVSINPETGAITIGSGLPTGTHTVGVAVTDDTGATATGELNITVGSATGGMSIVLPQGASTRFGYTRGGTVTVGANGGAGPYSFTLAGANTAAISISPDGVISIPAGTCEAREDAEGNIVGYAPSGDGVKPGNYNLIVRATDSAGNTSDQQLSITVVNNCGCEAAGNFSPYGCTGF